MLKGMSFPDLFVASGDQVLPQILVPQIVINLPEAIFGAREYCDFPANVEMTLEPQGIAGKLESPRQGDLEVPRLDLLRSFRGPQIQQQVLNPCKNEPDIGAHTVGKIQVDPALPEDLLHLLERNAPAWPSVTEAGDIDPLVLQ